MSKFTNNSPGPENVLHGIVPTYGYFTGTAPTNLANATDGNESNPCGTGTTTTAGTIGIFTFDRGAGNTGPMLIDMNVGLWSTNGNIWCVCKGSPDNSSYPAGQRIIYQGVVSTTEVKPEIQPVIIHTRYFQLVFGTDGVSMTGNVKLYEVMGYSLTP